LETGLAMLPAAAAIGAVSLLVSALHPAGPWNGRRLLRGGKYDVVHVHAGPFSPLAFTGAALAADLPTVVTVHSLISYMEPAFRLLDRAVGWSSLPAVWTAVSDTAAEPVRRLVAPEPVFVLPNGIDAASWHVDPLPRVPGEVLVVAVMRLAPRKRPQHLVRMLRRAHAALAPAVRMRAVIVGEGPERRSIERYLRRHAMTGWVSLPGRVDRARIRELFRKADLFVAPAMLESFGIAALEARCAGLPVVARSEGGIREFVRDGQEGILADSDHAMVDAIVRLASDQELRSRIATYSRTVPPPVTWPDVLRRTEEMYDLAIERLQRQQARPAPADGGRAGLVG
ncbi:glycosyltransferase family 4 protein, partial [Actinomadura roseirufa]|uniref:glycosyltransferase family 4 protein n=1 Tax=Actinomadura roseirufa TaxID=2094049 RepID=UPI001041AB9F